MHRSISRIRRPFTSCIVALVGLSGCDQAAFVVNTDDDLHDDNPGDGLCRAAGAPELCSLRAAIEEADAGEIHTHHIISLPAGNYAISNLPGVAIPSAGLSMSSVTVTIEGAGRDVTIVEPSYPARHFTIDHGALQLSGMTLRNGSGPASNGGAISATDANLVIADAILEDNQAYFVGGAISAVGGGLAYRLAIADTIIRDNEAALGAAGGGGGVYADIPVNFSRVQVQNNIGGNGGGLWLLGAASDLSSIENSAFVENQAHTGGAIKIQTDGEVMISQSTISSNIGCLRGGGLYIVDGDVDIASSTLAHNEIASGTIGSSLCNPTSGHHGAGIEQSGGDPVMLLNTIMAQNTTLGQPTDCDADIVSGGFNFVGTGDGCNVTPAASDQVGTPGAELNPSLGPLTMIGSPTDHHLPLVGSPVLDAGAACGVRDQRGMMRPRDGDGNGVAVCDIGAIER